MTSRHCSGCVLSKELLDDAIILRHLIVFYGPNKSQNAIKSHKKHLSELFAVWLNWSRFSPRNWNFPRKTHHLQWFLIFYWSFKVNFWANLCRMHKLIGEKRGQRRAKNMKKWSKNKKSMILLDSMYTMYCLFNSPLVSMFTTKNPLLKLTAPSIRIVYVVSFRY